MSTAAQPPTAVPGLVDASMAVQVTPAGQVAIQVRPHRLGVEEHDSLLIEIVIPAGSRHGLAELVASLAGDAAVTLCAMGVRIR